MKISSFAAIGRIVVCSAAVGCIGAVGACGDASASNTEVSMVPASLQSFAITTVATGELEAQNQVEIRSQVERQTTILDIVPEGTRVRAGDVIVRLNSDEIQREIEEEELQVISARLDLEAANSEYEIQESDNAANLRKAELAVELAELALEQWREGDHEKMIQDLATAKEKARRDLDRLRERKQKSDELYLQRVEAGEVPFISYDEWKRDEIALLEGEAAFEKAKLEERVYLAYQMKRDDAQKLSDLQEAKRELERVRQTNEINLKNKASNRENRQVQLARRQERLAGYQAQLEASTIRAPRDGLFIYATSLESQSWRRDSEGPLAVGRQIRPNDLIAIIPDTSEMVAVVKVHESLAGRVRPGQRAEVSVEAAGGVIIGGTVDSVGILAESGGWRDPNRREYSVRIALDPTEAEIKPSMRCEARLTLGEVDEAITVPVQAVFSDGAVRYVYVREGSGFVRRPVSLGRRSDLYAEIRSGIEPGTEVLVREPMPGEIVQSDWDQAELVAAGYTVDDDGNPVSTRPAGFRSGRPAPQGGGEARSIDGGGTSDMPVETVTAAE